MLLLSVATDHSSQQARDAAAAPRLGLQTLVAVPSAAAGASNVATCATAASRRAVCGGDEAGGGGGEDEGCCWVSYGWRRSPRRLPPPLPSLRAVALARARTADGRLVISREEPAHRVCARKVEDRLVLDFVERDGCSAAPPPPQQQRLLRRWSHPLTFLDARAPAAATADDDDEVEVAAEDGVAARHAVVRAPALQAPTS
ncbi:hypothetical protein ACP70R_041577 [Stipagrostis hirtigluma subsp. patula]